MEYVDKQVRGVFFSVLFIVLICFVISFGVVYDFRDKGCPDGFHQEFECFEEVNYGGVYQEYWACVVDGIVDLNEYSCNDKILIRQYSEPERKCLKGHNICVRVD